MTTPRVYGAARFNAPGTFAGLDFAADSRTLVALLPGEERSRIVRFAVDGGAIASRQEIEGEWSHLRVLPDGDVVVSSWGRVSRISAAGEVVWTVKGAFALQLAAVTRDGALLATVEHAKVQVRDSKKGRVVRTVDEKDGDVHAIAFSGDGKLLATGSAKGVVRVYDARSGAERAKRKSTKVLALAFSPAGDLLLGGHGNGDLALWQVKDLKPVRFSGHHAFDIGGGAGCRWVGFSPDGARAYSLGNEHRVRVWNVPQGGEALTIGVPGRHAQGSVTALSPDGRWLATGSTKGALSVWSTVDGAPLVTDAAPGPILGLALTRGAVAAASSSVCVAWDRAAGKATEVPTNFPPTDVVGLASGTLVRLDYQSIFVGDALDASEAASFELSEYASGALALSRGQTLLAAPAQEHVELWDLARGVNLARLPHAERTRACAFGPADAWLVTADDAVHLWRLGALPEPIRDIPLASDDDASVHVRGLAVSERGYIAVSVDASDNNADAESALVVIDPRSGDLLARLARPGVRLGQVAFVGGLRIAITESSGRLLLVDASDPSAPRWLEPEVADDVWPDTSMREALPLATLGDQVAHVGPDGNVIVRTLPAVQPDAGAPFLLAPEGPAKVDAATSGMFAERLAGTRFIYAGRFKSAGAEFREQTVKDLGGEVASKPDARVTHLVLGDKPAKSVQSGLASKGATFKTLSEAALIGLLLPTAAEARALLRGDVKRAAERWNTWRERHAELGGEGFPTSLQGIDLEGLDLREYQLRVLDFTAAKLVGVNLAGVDLFDVVFRNADLRGADFTGGACFRTIFTGADLRGVRLGAELSCARFDGARLDDTDFTGAGLQYVDFSGADLRGARLPKTLPELTHNAKTRWPDGVRPC